MVFVFQIVGCIFLSLDPFLCNRDFTIVTQPYDIIIVAVAAQLFVVATS